MIVRFNFYQNTVSIMNLVQGNEMIIFESILTAFIARFIFEAVKTLSNIGCRGSNIKWLGLEIEPPQANLACPNCWKALLWRFCKNGSHINIIKLTETKSKNDWNTLKKNPIINSNTKNNTSFFLMRDASMCSIQCWNQIYIS